MKVPRGRPPPALGSARKVTEVRCEENMQARTGGNTLEGLQVISLGCIGEKFSFNRIANTNAFTLSKKKHNFHLIACPFFP